jgi:hypothetical protein
MPFISPAMRFFSSSPARTHPTLRALARGSWGRHKTYRESAGRVAASVAAITTNSDVCFAWIVRSAQQVRADFERVVTAEMAVNRSATPADEDACVIKARSILITGLKKRNFRGASTAHK